jgi:hypothetical protein
VHMPRHFLTTWTEPWGFIKSSAQTYTVHMKLSLCMSFSTQTQPRGLHGGHHHGISSPDHGGLSPIITPPNPTTVHTISYEYLFYLPSSELLRPTARGLLLGSCTPGTMGYRLWPKNLDTVSSHQQQAARKQYIMYWIWPHHSWLKRRGHLPKKN